MKRYGLRSYDELLDTWNAGQVLLALDAIFWSNAKEEKDFRPSKRDLEAFSHANQDRPLTARMLAGLE